MGYPTKNSLKGWYNEDQQKLDLPTGFTGRAAKFSKQQRAAANAACEGLFGRLKNELFYPRDWKNATIEHFIEVVDSYIRWYNEK